MSDLNVIGFGWRFPDFPTDGSSFSDFTRQIRENLDVLVSYNYDSAWVADHFIPWPDWQEEDTPTIECLTTISYYSALYPQIKWGSTVFCQSYRNPAALAKAFAQLCALNPGKYIFGIGAGWKEKEYIEYNFPFPKPSVRITQMAEAIQIAKLLWTQSNATFEGKHYRIHEATVNPKPDPLPPIMVGGAGEKLTMRVAAQYADWWNLSGGSIETFRHKLEVLRRHCEDVGRSYDSIVKSWSSSCVAVADSSSQAERIARSSPFYSEDSAIFGTPDEVARQVEARISSGVQHFQLRFADFPSTRSMELFGREVIPRFLS